MKVYENVIYNICFLFEVLQKISHLTFLFFLSVLISSTGSHLELRSQLLQSLHQAVAQKERRVSHLPTGHPVPDPLSGPGQLHRQHGGKPEPGHEVEAADPHY